MLLFMFVYIYMNSGTNSFCTCISFCTGIEFGIFFEIIIYIKYLFCCIHDFVYFLVFLSGI